jgi:protein-S-isoprenylcysteine O-methyltransferase Ste14
MTLALRGSYVWECGLWERAFGRAVMGLWAGVALAVITSLVLRVPMEDKMLRKRFGDEWEEWKREVSWKIVPWLF